MSAQARWGRSLLICLALGSAAAELPSAELPSLDHALDLHAAGRKDEAYTAFRAVLDEAMHVFRHDDFARAEELLQDWLSHFEQLEGEDLSNLALPRSFLARCLVQLDSPQAGLPLADTLLAGIRFDHHEHTDVDAVIAVNTGIVYLANGKLAPAEKCLEHATHIVQEMPASPTVLHLEVLGALRSLRVAQGRIEEARQISEVRMNQLARRRQEDPQLAEALTQLDSAHALRQQPGADFREVSARMAAAAEILGLYLGPNDPQLLQLQMQQAQALMMAKGAPNSTFHLLEDALERLRLEPILNRNLIAYTQGILALVIADQGDRTRALAMLEDSLALYVEDGSQGDSGYEIVRKNLCEIVRAMGTRHRACP